MRIPTGLQSSTTIAAVSDRVRALAVAIAAGWNIDHKEDGRHRFGAEAVPFSASHFTGSGSMTWTVAAGSVVTNRAARIGQQLLWTFELAGTTVGGTPSSNLRIKLPGGVRAKGRWSGPLAIVDNGTPGCGVWIVTDESDLLQVFVNYTIPTWTAGAASLIGDLLLEVQ